MYTINGAYLAGGCSSAVASGYISRRAAIGWNSEAADSFGWGSFLGL